MSGGAGPSKKPKTNHFHTEWEEENVERPFRTVHINYDINSPPESDLSRRKVKELKPQSCQQLSRLPQVTSKAKAASFRVNKKSSRDGEMAKEAFVEAAGSLFNDFKNKTETPSSIRALQLSRNTVAAAEGIRKRLWEDVADCECSWMLTILTYFQSFKSFIEKR